jgi:hypothetical protein
MIKAQIRHREPAFASSDHALANLIARHTRDRERLEHAAGFVHGAVDVDRTTGVGNDDDVETFLVRVF